MQAANKNPPWARSVGGNIDNVNNAGMGGGTGMMQYGGGGGGAMYGQGIMQNSGAGMMGMQGGMAMGQMAGGMYPGNVVAYPTPRAMAGGFPSQAQPSPAEQRVFTGTVTKTHNDFGFVDHDVFYQTSVCAKGVLPKVNDRVLVEATYNANMPFKWNATRVQVLTSKNAPTSGSSGYNAVPPPSGGGARDNDRFRKGGNARRDDSGPRRNAAPPKRARSKTPPRARSKRRDSPPRKRAPRRSPTPPPKYVVRVPRIPLDISDLDVTSMSQRYSNMYIPSDFFASTVRWSEAFPPQYPFTLHNSSHFHIMHKEVPNPVANDAILEPPDADYRFSAKVMLISLPNLESLYQKCGLTKVDSREKRDKAPLHPTRLIKFLVGQKAKGGESFAIGGPWSPSLDGPNPESDPSVLVKTAIRTTKALTGIDLTPCTQWFRMVEFYYWREGSGESKSRLETVVLFLPDVWSAMPSRPEWTHTQDIYKKALDDILNPPAEQPEPAADATKIDETMNESTASEGDATLTDSLEEKPRKEPTHYSALDMRTIKVEKLREELAARGLSSRGLRAQLFARLSKVLKTEEEEEKKSEEEAAAAAEAADKQTEEDKEDNTDDADVVEIKDDAKDDTPKKPEIDEKQVSLLRSRYGLPASPHLIVHPSPTARGGKFNCTTATLSLLLDYRITDNKEHSFEIFVFAELFNEMLQRDFGFYIYKTLYTLPEREEDKKEKERERKRSEEKDKKDDKKDDKEAEKKDDKKEEEVKEKDGREKDRDVKDKDKDSKEKDRDSKDKDKDSKEKDGKRRGRESVESDVPKRHSRGVELPPDPYLLLALVYFDTARCAYLMRRDLQLLFMSLGLQLSRSQLKHLLDKVCVKDNFNYKSLMTQIRELSSGTSEALQDMPLDSVSVTTQLPSIVAELEATIASGNRDLLPVFDDGSHEDGSGDTKQVSDSGMVMYKGRLVDVGATLAALTRSEQTSTRLDSTLGETRSALRAARSSVIQHGNTIKGLQGQLAEITDQLSKTKSRLSAVTASSKLFHSTLRTVQSQVEAVVNINFEEDANAEVQIVNGPTNVTKVEQNDDIKEETKPNAEAEHDEKPADEQVTNVETVKAENVEESSDVLQPENMDIDDK